MKTLFRILIVLSLLAIIFFYSSNMEDNYEPLEGPNSSSQVIPKTDSEPKEIQDALPRPETGISTLIGKQSNELLKLFGEPSRYDRSPYGYDWWVYNEDYNKFSMFAVKDNKVTQAYSSGELADVSPYKMGQSLAEIYQMTIMESEITATIGENIYTFTLSEDDMNTRILTKLGDIFAQLYIDSESGKLSGIRFLDSQTLVLHRPYEMSFVGELISPPSPNSYLIEESNKDSAAQLFDLLNVFRVNNDIPIINYDVYVSVVAMQHSEDMYTENYLSHDSPTNGSLKDRLEEEGILYEEAEENIATAYIDSIEAAHGWLNSRTHREYMLSSDYTHVGSGVFINYYTQIFIQKNEDE
ncbi:CAP domain-containing protein [Ureibacillus sp. 179-F W5.1 NHS]|uniref:CAP domain-containing protein n=1 Tax=Lysinibacillus halotolerans TaxID=1368476 RepID=A0A3M8HGS0_9BACI|nr:CAP domain-containing protein [Lysinibacillus halotolerans]RND01597.1 hypothetical protein EC501_00055 [Lysinibacillus halotolerans]